MSNRRQCSNGPAKEIIFYSYVCSVISDYPDKSFFVFSVRRYRICGSGNCFVDVETPRHPSLALSLVGSLFRHHCSQTLYWNSLPSDVQSASSLATFRIQLAQLWQRDRAKLDTFFINVQRYSQNHAQNCIFAPPHGGIRDNLCALSESFNAKRLRSRVSWRKCQLYS